MCASTLSVAIPLFRKSARKLRRVPIKDARPQKQKNVSKSEWPKTLKSLNQRKKLFDFYDFKAPA